MSYHPHVVGKRRNKNRGATHCIKISKDKDFTDEMVTRLLETAQNVGAILPQRMLYVIQFPFSSERLLTEADLRDMLKAYMLPAPVDPL